jgi:two-component system, sensor histidine kinase RegB
MKNFISFDANRKNLLQLVFLRLFAIIGQIITILAAEKFLSLQLPKHEMFNIISVLAVVNLLSFYRYQYQKNITNRSLFFELIVDVVALTAQLYFSGGIYNPFISLFLLQVIIAAILLRAVFAWIIAAITICCYVWLIFNFIDLSFSNENFFDIHLHGMLISYVIAALLLLIFITRMAKNLREQQEFMRSAMLATAAAHDLGTPLNTISIVLEDWQKFEAKNFSDEMKKDLSLIESQIKRCKEAVSKILSASKSERMEQAKERDFK